jgi:hypothetical protein
MGKSLGLGTSYIYMERGRWADGVGVEQHTFALLKVWELGVIGS